MGQNKTVSNSFADRPTSQLATLSTTSPAQPQFMFVAHALGTTGAQDHKWSASMFVFGGANNAPGPSSSPSPPRPARTLNEASILVPEWLASQQEADDEDMPDTDPGESFSEDAK
jgi:hypothetical protein